MKKGAPLAVIESPDVGNAFADLGKAQADLIAAEHDFKRQKELFDAHAGSQKDFEAAEDNYRKAKAELDRARSRRRALFRERRRRRGHAGVHAARADRRRGRSRATSTPAPRCRGSTRGGTAVELFTIGELDHVWVLADVFEMDLGARQEGRARHACKRRRLSRPASSRARSTGSRARSIPTTRTAQGALHDRQPRARAQARDVRDGVDRRSPSARRWRFRARRCCASAIRRSSSSRPAPRPTGSSRFERRARRRRRGRGRRLRPGRRTASSAGEQDRHRGRDPARPECSEERSVISKLVALRAADARHRRLILASGIARRRALLLQAARHRGVPEPGAADGRDHHAARTAGAPRRSSATSPSRSRSASPGMLGPRPHPLAVALRPVAT